MGYTKLLPDRAATKNMQHHKLEAFYRLFPSDLCPGETAHIFEQLILKQSAASLYFVLAPRIEGSGGGGGGSGGVQFKCKVEVGGPGGALTCLGSS